MSDLDPTPLYPALEDPAAARLMHRRVDPGRTARLLDSDERVATSLSVVVIGAAGLRSVVEQLVGWSSARLRIEVLVMTRRGEPHLGASRELLAPTGRSWRLIERPAGGRAAAMWAAAEHAESEFILVASGGNDPFHLVAGALAAMWADGGDVALIDSEPSVPGSPPTHERVDPAAELVNWLGLAAAPADGRVVVLRRWVARWLFNEVTRAISPAEEVADRARLLGIGIIQIDQGPSDG